jgi:small subunit ribosomal protein S6
MTLEGEGGMVKEVERRLRVTEPVIKFITVRIDEEQKRLAKIKAIRDTKVRGKGTRAAAAAEAAEAAPPAVPAAAPAAPESAPAEGAETAPASA